LLLSTACHVCRAYRLEPVKGFAQLRRVTSDCKPWPAGGELVVCTACGTVQKPRSEAWKADARAIYSDYAIYHQAGGVEQGSFTPDTGASTPRSNALLRCITTNGFVVPKGRLLDVGCGNGAWLRVFSAANPSWRLAGTELDDRYRAEVEAIPRVEALFTSHPADVPGRFDLITMIHVLEHIADPAGFLDSLRSTFTVQGRLLVHVPNHEHNPFDLLIADHSSHFSPRTLEAVLVRADYRVEALSTEWVAKEQSAIATVATAESKPGQPSAVSRDGVASRVEWLKAVRDEAVELARRGRLGIFGTSIAGVWLAAEVGKAVEFFVDEDVNRQGRSLLGLPILSPDNIRSDADVYLALPTPIAASVAARLQRPSLRFHIPPTMPR
jgi:2-polyprenyl-3-methyl-5-hydroxy-6-metoxy-1,4-benzoquinol methylase